MRVVEPIKKNGSFLGRATLAGYSIEFFYPPGYPYCIACDVILSSSSAIEYHVRQKHARPDISLVPVFSSRAFKALDLPTPSTDFQGAVPNARLFLRRYCNTCRKHSPKGHYCCNKPTKERYAQCIGPAFVLFPPGHLFIQVSSPTIRNTESASIIRTAETTASVSEPPSSTPVTIAKTTPTKVATPSINESIAAYYKDNITRIYNENASFEARNEAKLAVGCVCFFLLSLLMFVFF